MKSFSDVLSGQNSIEVKPVSSFKGEPAVFFSAEEIEVLAQPFKFALVGKFGFKSRPSMVKIKKFFISLGIKSLLSVGLLNDSVILINLGVEEDYARLLLRAIWYVEGSVMKLMKWSPEFNPTEDSPVVPVWIGFPGLPVHFFNRTALFSIARAVGNPLKSDESTALFNRPSVARVCAEVDVSKAWPKRIWIGEEKKGFWQEVCLENPPLFCSYCKILGHGEEGCFKIHPSLLEALKKKKEEEKKDKNRKINEDEARKKKGKAITVPVACTQVFRPKTASHSSAVVTEKNVRRDKEEFHKVPHSLEKTLVPITGIALTPLPNLAWVSSQEGSSVHAEQALSASEFHPSLPLEEVQRSTLGPETCKSSEQRENAKSFEVAILPLDQAGLQNQPLDCSGCNLEFEENSDKVEQAGTEAVVTRTASSATLISMTDLVTINTQLVCGGKELGSSDLFQSKGKEECSQSRGDNTLEATVSQAVVSGEKSVLAEGFMVDKIQPLINPTIKFGPSDRSHLNPKFQLEMQTIVVTEIASTAEPVILEATGAQAVALEKNSKLAADFQNDKIQPLDKRIGKIQPLDIVKNSESQLHERESSSNFSVQPGKRNNMEIDVQIPPSDLADKDKIQPKDSPIDSQPLVLSVNENYSGRRCRGSVDVADASAESQMGKIRPLDQVNFKIQPLDHLLISDNAKSKLLSSVNKGGCDGISLEEIEISSQPLITQFQSQPSTILQAKLFGLQPLGFEFFNGSSSSGLHILNENAVSPVGLQASGLEQQQLMGRIAENPPDLFLRGLEPPKQVSSSFGGSISMSYEEREVFSRVNLIHIHPSLCSFLKNQGIKLKPLLREKIFQFLSSICPELIEEKEGLDWIWLQNCLIDFLKQLQNIKVTRRLQKALELFFKKAISDGRPLSFSKNLVPCSLIQELNPMSPSFE